MKKKSFLLILLPSLLLVGCRKNDNSTSASPSIPSPSVVDSSSATPSENTSTSISTIPEKTAFGVPTNVKIEGNILSFDAQVGATNGYTVKYYLQGLETNFNTFVIESNSVDLSLDEYQGVLPRGIVLFQVHVNATEEHYVSPYSSPVSLLYGVHNNLVEVFMNRVDELEEVTIDSLDLLNECKAAYAALDEVDVLDERVKAYVDILTAKEVSYLDILFSNVSLVHEDHKTKEWQETIDAIKEFYLAMIDKNSELVSKYLTEVVSYSYEYETYAITSEENVTLINLVAKNFLGEIVVVDGLKANIAEDTINLEYDNGIYYLKHKSDFTLVLNDLEIGTINYHNSLDAAIDEIEGKDVFKFNYTGEASEFVIKVYETKDIKIVGETPIVTAMPIHTFTSSSDVISMKELTSFLLENGMDEESIISLVFSIRRGGVESPIYVNENYLGVGLGTNSKKLFNPHEVYNQPIYFTEDGGIEYKWEILTQNEEYKYNLTKGIQFDFYVGESFDENTEILSSLLITNAGFLTYDQIMGQLKVDYVSVNEPLHAVAKMVRSDNSPLIDSDYVEVEGSYKYDIDYRLSRKYTDNFNVDQGNGRLVWAWEIFDSSNIEGKYIKNAEVLVFDEAVTNENEAEPLTTFTIDFNAGDRFTYKEDIEHALSLANLSSGNYRFSMRLIAKEDLGFENSELYPITDSFYYETISMAEMNIVKGCATYASYGDGSAATDGNLVTRWINGTNDIEKGWLIIDLGEVRSLKTVKVYWEGAYAKDYEVLLVNEIDPANFDGNTAGMNVIASVSERTEYKQEADEFDVTGASGRYLVISCITKGTPYAYSIFEVEAYLDV